MIQLALVGDDLKLKEASDMVRPALQVKTEFLEHLSHDFRTPINVIIGFSELMLDEVPGTINEEQRQCLDDISNSGKRLLNLINGMFDVYRTEVEGDGDETDSRC
ncbi:sensor histidine kinase [Chloroflexota bacterium]